MRLRVESLAFPLHFLRSMNWLGSRILLNTLFRRIGFVCLSVFVTVSTWAATLPNSDVDVTVVGDVRHGSSEVLRIQIDYFRQVLKMDPSYNCLVLEIDRYAEVHIQKFLRGDDYSTSVKPWIDSVGKVFGSQAANIIPAWYLRQSYDMGLRIFGGDVNHSQNVDPNLLQATKRLADPTIEPKYEADVRLVVERRSWHMARRVEELLKKGTCQKAFIVFGDGHLYESAHQIRVQTTQEFLAKFGLKVHIIRDLGMDYIRKLDMEMGADRLDQLAFHAE